ncbi:unnamed protein product [Owenia fusiformis]|uniref:Palmitoyltransferase n=1 Tax=Owenia fusiformis TaxID=6347 RepID=A0A8S4PN43_OWEFU|nr:unnamed protein product [Owenia fusiformis]
MLSGHKPEAMNFVVAFGSYVGLVLVLILLYFMRDLPLFKTGLLGEIRNTLIKVSDLLVPELCWKLLEGINWRLFKQRTMFFQVVYMFLLFLGYFEFVVEVLPFLHYFYEQENHINVPIFNFLTLVTLLVISSISNPGIITEKNVRGHVKYWGTDGLVYWENTQCATCKLPKPARSKHCSLCGHCVFKFDHHCIWTNSCLGGNNYRYFILFLLNNLFFFTYGTWMVMRALGGIIEHMHLWDVKYIDDNDQPQPMNYSILIHHLFMKFPRMVFLAASGIFLDIAVGIFTLFHIMLAFTNQTTNERHRRGFIESVIKRLANTNKNDTHERKTIGNNGLAEIDKNEPIDSVKDNVRLRTKGIKGTEYSNKDNQTSSKRQGKQLVYHHVEELLKKHSSNEILQRLSNNPYDLGFFKNIWSVFFPLTVPGKNSDIY